MNNNQRSTDFISAQTLRKRKLLLVLPLLTLPFITMAFWALGGGSANKDTLQNSTSNLNLQLPKAHLKDDASENKLSFYEQADQDSLKLGNEIKNDHYLNYRSAHDSLSLNSSDEKYVQQATGYSDDPNERKTYEKIAEINKQLNSTPTYTSHASNSELSTEKNSDAIKESKEKLDQTLQNMNNENASNSDDQDMDRLNEMMDKIINIQHPERLQNINLRNKTLLGNQVVVITKISGSKNISLLDTNHYPNLKSQSKFYGLEDSEIEDNDNAIITAVHGEQILTNGSVIKLRILEDIYINGVMLPASSFVFGIASLNGERLNIEVTSIKKGFSILPVKLQAYDMDGLPGIYIPGAISRDVSKASLDNATQMIEPASMDPSVKGQATNVGVNAIKNLLSRKVKLIKVTVKAGYRILLKEITNQ